MPAFTLPMITITPNNAISSVTPASMALCVGPAVSGLLVVMETPSGIAASGLRPPLRHVLVGALDLVGSVSAGEETGLFHQDFVALFFRLEPFDIVGTGQERRIEVA